MANSKRPANYTGVNTAQFISAFKEVLLEDDFNSIFPVNSNNYKKILTLFTVALSDMNRLFPNSGVKQTSTNPKDYIRKWVAKFSNALQTPPSKRTAKLPGSAVDPALAVMVKTHQELTDQEIIERIKAHQLFMSAENIQGNLLEEYIASIAEPQGWIWARGETLRACDFVKPSGIISHFVQIKNRDNTENSSSSAIRDVTQIQKWYRLKTLHKDKKPYPTFMWNELNELMELKEPIASESSYQDFLKKVISNNQQIIRTND